MSRRLVREGWLFRGPGQLAKSPLPGPLQGERGFSGGLQGFWVHRQAKPPQRGLPQRRPKSASCYHSGAMLRPVEGQRVLGSSFVAPRESDLTNTRFTD